jgi:protein phosphatase
MIKLRSAGLTDIGRVRRNNEDRLLCDEKAMFFGVADGVGGLPGGAEAAERTLEEVTLRLRASHGHNMPDLAAIVHETNEAVQELGRSISPDMGIASTLTFAHIRNHTLHLAHIGDSRAYLWRAGRLSPLTSDHSVENEARARRARGEKIFFHEVNRNALTRCMGQPTPPDPDVIAHEIQAGDRYLFCTDGVTRLVNEAELEEVLGKDADPAKLLQDIVSLALRRGGHDNATGVLVFIDALE